MSFSVADSAFMAEAIRLARLGQYTTSPNPNVGAVIVKNDRIVGRGYHRQAGQSHAEVYALQEAGTQAEGATCYVTLEPCSHYGRTPPCAEALIKAGVKRVVVAMLDPNPLVSGKGIAMLRAAGIRVESGLQQHDARALNQGFLSRMERQRPYVRLKLAASLDGRTALSNGKSQWLTGPQARADVQQFRARSCAILSTATTVLADQARLTLRPEQLLQAVPALSDGSLRQPKRVILDRQQKLTGNEPLFLQGSDVIVCVPSLDKLSSLPQIARQLVCPLQQQQFDLPALLQTLAVKEQINELWIESGPTLAGALLQAGLVDELIVYVAPKLLGDSAMPLTILPQFTELAQVTQLQWQDIRQVGPDLRLTATVQERED